MDVTFLGTGSAMPTGERVQTGLLLESGDDSLLLDCGSGVLHRLAATETGYEGVDAVLLTHHHLDHVSDLMPFLKARWLAGATDVEVVGPPGTESLLDDLHDAHEYMRDRVDLVVREVDAGEPFEVAGFEVEGFETRHSMDCLAYRFADSFAFSGDSEAFAGLADFADGVDVFVHDCSFPDEIDVSNHPTPTQLGEALAGHDYGEVHLTHLYPHTDGKHREMVQSVREHYDGEVHVAREGTTVETDE
ncbi:MBL fold metallo-hydrolase [Halospeciosus flavus]|uniref:MBL fold metallo-hydrolase n=1 Tax=Halospeciosus flavus TaxID=3032283 RepID=A0ABD5Z8S4_9EURY|nr:MBL fold metallo-hydrolase [Halospeciosus flavus]